eukprot:6988190-Prymnesium_polylepis.1
MHLGCLLVSLFDLCRPLPRAMRGPLLFLPLVSAGRAARSDALRAARSCYLACCCPKASPLDTSARRRWTVHV